MCIDLYTSVLHVHNYYSSNSSVYEYVMNTITRVLIVVVYMYNLI